MTVLIPAFCFYLIFIFCIFRLPYFNLKNISRAFLVILFSIKAVVPIILSGYAITLFNGSDSVFYFTHGELLQQLSFTDFSQFLSLMLGQYNTGNAYAYYTILNVNFLPPYGDGELMIKINTLLHFVSFHSLHAHTLFFAFLSFCGLTGFYKAVEIFTGCGSKIFYMCLILFPSLLIYTSPILKETLLAGISGLFIYFLSNVICKKEQYLPCILSGALLLLIKPYFILLLAPILISIVLLKILIRSVILRTLCACVFVSFYFLTISALSEKFTGDSIPDKIALAQQSSLKSSVYLKAGSYSSPPIIASSFSSLGKNIPAAFGHALKVPSFSFSSKKIINLAAFENMIIVTMLLVNVAGCLVKENRFRDHHLCIVLFVFLFYALTGFTQSLEGIIIRLKVPVLPFIISGVYLLLTHYRNGRRKYEFIFD